MRQLSAHIGGALRKPLPAPVLEKTKHHVLDTLAAMVSGSRLLPGRKAIEDRGGGPAPRKREQSMISLRYSIADAKGNRLGQRSRHPLAIFKFMLANIGHGRP